MRVLILHSRYLSGSTSGENRVVDDEAHLLREAGHEVALLQPSLEGVGGARLARAAADVVWNAPAAAAVRGAIASFGPDVVHVHNLFPAVSPAAIRAAARAGVPTVMTLHNYRLMCLPATLFRDGAVCEDCVGRAPLPGVRHGCYRGSRPASAALAASHILHRSMGTFDAVSLFIAVGGFVRDRHVAAGFDRGRFVVKPNFAWPVPRRVGPGEAFLFLGRITPEKGLDTLLDAWRGLDVPLEIAGDGPDAERLQAQAPAHVRFLGSVPGEDVPGLLARARAVLVPSRWYEAAPRVIAEAYAAGVPVIASDLGALPDAVEVDRTGLLAAHDDPDAWRGAVSAVADDATSLRLGDGAYAYWAKHLAPEASLRALEAAYERVRVPGEAVDA